MRAARTRARAGVASVFVLATAATLPTAAGVSSAAPRGAAPGGPTSSATSLAKSVNLTAADMPASLKWASAAQPSNNKATAAAGKKAAACLQRAGAATDDAFGASEVTGGSVRADVKSPQFSDKANAFTQLPAANSEVVVVSSAKQATADLAALAKKASLTCLAAQYLVDVEQSGSGSAKVSAGFMSRPHHGSGNGGVAIRLVTSGGLLPQKLYNDEYFYVQGPVEVVLSFLNLGSPFTRSWADAAAAKVMQRAAKAT